MRYVPEWQRFLVYNGQIWEPDLGPIVDAIIRDEARQLFIEAGAEADDIEPDQWRDFLRFAKAMNSARGVENARRLLQSEPDMATAVSALDRHQAVLNVCNGIVDLRTGTLKPHDSGMLLTRIARVEYDPTAKRPVWERFIEQVFPDVELRAHVKRVIGYTIGASVREQLLFILHGTGANGKSTLVETLMEMLGSYATSAAPDLLMAKGDSHPTEIADLHGHRFVTCSETDEGRRLAESRVKLLTGGDTLTARRMRENFWTFTPTHKLFLLTNHRPQLRGTDIGLRRRLHLIPFAVTFAPAEQDRNLRRKLRDELPGILAWCVEGAIEWNRDGLGESLAVTAATTNYVSDQDVIGRFITERCIMAAWAKVRASSLYAAYRAWCEEQGEQVGTLTRFGQSITERGIVKRNSNGVWYDGIGIKETQESEPLE